MALKHIVTLVGEVVTSLGDSAIKYAHGDKGWQNLIVDGVLSVEKIIYVDEPITSNDQILDNSRILPSYPLRMVFGQQTKLDFTPEQHLPVIAAMRDLARQFTLKLIDTEDEFDRKVFAEVTGMRRIDFINLFDANMSGTVLELTVKPLSPESICA